MSAESASEIRFLISACEASSDAHGAELLRELRDLAPAGYRVRAFGVGGPRLQAAGLSTVVDARELLAMGFTEVLARLPRIMRAFRRLWESVENEGPDYAVVLDYPDFHLRLARRLYRKGIPATYYIPPKTWVWRTGRVRALGKWFRQLLCILPFEEEFYRARGVKAKYVGSPLVDELPFELKRSEARKRLEIGEREYVVLAMPGSRPAELREHLGLALGAALRLRTALAIAGGDETPAFRVVLPAAETLDEADVRARVAAWKAADPSRRGALQIDVVEGGLAHVGMVAADLGLVKSGTSTLEAALLGLPHVIFYRAGKVATFVFKKLIRYQGPVALANLAASGPAREARRVLPELIADAATEKAIADAALGLAMDRSKREQTLGELMKLRERTIGGAAKNAARAIWADLLAGERVGVAGSVADRARLAGLPALPGGWLRRIGVALVSFAWSVTNFVVRAFTALRGTRVRLGTRVVGVGNIQAGGAGKTPLVAMIANEAAARGLQVCILTRGYRGRWEQSGGILPPGPAGSAVSVEDCGDEAMLLHQKAPKSWIAVGADRAAQFVKVTERSGTPFDLVLLDDGYQSRQIDRDLDIVAMTSRRWWDVVHRDFPFVVKREDLKIWTKGERRPQGWPSTDAEGGVRMRFSTAALADKHRGRSFWLVTGIADPEAALASLRTEGWTLRRLIARPDHAQYSRDWVERLISEAQAAGCGVLTTGKDWVKWSQLGVTAGGPVVVAEPELEIISGREAWDRALWGGSRL